MGRRYRQRWSQSCAPMPKTWRYVQPNPLYIGLATLDNNGPWQAEKWQWEQEAVAIAQHRFCFLHHAVEMGNQIKWHDPTASQLWRYHLHYFSYVPALLVWSQSGEVQKAHQTFRRLVNSWIENNQQIRGDGWHPYTISLRLVNWLNALAAFEVQGIKDDAFRQHLLSSAYGQAQILFADLELDVRGNHLLENLRALLWLGVVFHTAEAYSWWQKALRLLQREVAEQILVDGGHFERTPTYHLVILKDLLEIALWLQRNGYGNLAWLDAALRRMLNYLLAILPPDRHIPLFKDTAWDAALSPQALLAAGALYFADPAYKINDHFGLYPYLLFGNDGWQQFQAMSIQPQGGAAHFLRDSGYVVMRDPQAGDFLLLDVGKPCPDYLPAHAHADLFSFELTVARQRVIVDSGVYEYQAGPWRNYFRSTCAHNTVEVMQTNQSEVWSSFRVARRARPTVTHWQAADQFVLVQASHNGYQRLSTPVTHRRTLLWVKDRFWLIVDELLGQGKTSAQNHIHLHPTLAFVDVQNQTWRIENNSVALWLSTFGAQHTQVIKGQEEPFYQGWYAEEFGKRQANPVLSLAITATLPLIFGYAVGKGSAVQLTPEISTSKREIKMIYQNYAYSLLLPVGQPPKFL